MSNTQTPACVLDLDRMVAKDAVNELCRRWGAQFVIDAAREHLMRALERAASEHQRRRQELEKAMKEST